MSDIFVPGLLEGRTAFITGGSSGINLHIARRYAADPVADPAGYEATLTRVQGLLGPQDNVLELGCGTGTHWPGSPTPTVNTLLQRFADRFHAGLSRELDRDVPVMLSMTLTDLSGRNLSGHTVEAFWYAVRHARPLTVGLTVSGITVESRPYDGGTIAPLNLSQATPPKPRKEITFELAQRALSVRITP